MEIGRIAGATRVLGKSQGYLGLPVRDDVLIDRATGFQEHCMVTAWIPTPKELVAINAGAAIHVTLLGRDHPPILVNVGEVPE